MTIQELFKFGLAPNVHDAYDISLHILYLEQ